MKVGIIQSSYIPWRGYFDIIDDVDLFIFLDDVQYTTRDWRNRNKIKTNNGSYWLTVAVERISRKSNENLYICERRINYESNWNLRHINQIKLWYKDAPYYAEYFDEIKELLNIKYTTISNLNVALCKYIMGKLSIKTRTIRSEDLNCTGSKTNKLINILKSVKATSYLSGPSAKSYLDYNLFKNNGIDLYFKTYKYPEYPQVHGKFIDNMSSIDLLFNTGPSARKYLKSAIPNLLIT